MRLNLCGTCLPGGAAQGPETGTEDGGTVLHVRVDLNKGLGVLYEHVEGMISFGLTHEGPTEHGSYGRMQVGRPLNHILSHPSQTG